MASRNVYLPPGWEEARDPSTGRIYYANRATGETSWKPPPLPRLEKLLTKIEVWHHS